MRLCNVNSTHIRHTRSKLIPKSSRFTAPTTTKNLYPHQQLQHQPNAFGFRSSTKDDRRKSNLDAPRVGTSVPPLPPPNNPSTLQSCCQSTAPLHQQLQQRSANSSGSLTTLTMKNNQLIVQTEELYVSV